MKIFSEPDRIDLDEDPAMTRDPRTDFSLLELITRRRVARSQERRDAAERAPVPAVDEPRTVPPAPPSDLE